MIAEKKEITVNGVECQDQCKADSKESLKVVDKEYRIVNAGIMFYFMGTS